MTSYIAGCILRNFLSLEEWHRLLAAAPMTRENALLWLMAGCGLRVSEVATLKAEHIDRAGYLHVVTARRKAAHLCHPKPALEALNAHLQFREGGYVF